MCSVDRFRITSVNHYIYTESHNRTRPTINLQPPHGYLQDDVVVSNVRTWVLFHGTAVHLELKGKLQNSVVRRYLETYLFKLKKDQRKTFTICMFCVSNFYYLPIFDFCH